MDKIVVDKAKYPKRINRYTITFPNVSTIENVA